MYLTQFGRTHYPFGRSLQPDRTVRLGCRARSWRAACVGAGRKLTPSSARWIHPSDEFARARRTRAYAEDPALRASSSAVLTVGSYHHGIRRGRSHEHMRPPQGHGRSRILLPTTNSDRRNAPAYAMHLTMGEQVPRPGRTQVVDRKVHQFGWPVLVKKNVGRGQRGDLHECRNNPAVVGRQGDITDQSRLERKVQHHSTRPIDLGDANPEMARIGQRGQRRSNSFTCRCVLALAWRPGVHDPWPRANLVKSGALAELEESMKVPTAMAATRRWGPLSSSQRAKAMDLVKR